MGGFCHELNCARQLHDSDLASCDQQWSCTGLNFPMRFENIMNHVDWADLSGNYDSFSVNAATGMADEEAFFPQTSISKGREHKPRVLHQSVNICSMTHSGEYMRDFQPLCRMKGAKTCFLLLHFNTLTSQEGVTWQLFDMSLWLSVSIFQCF